MPTLWRVSSPEIPVGLSYPPDKEDQARQGDAETEKPNPTLKAVERIPQGVEYHGGQESSDDPSVQDRVAGLEPLPPQDGAHQAACPAGDIRPRTSSTSSSAPRRPLDWRRVTNA